MASANILVLPLSGLCSISAALIYTIYLAKGATSSDGPAETRLDYIPTAYVAVASLLLYYIYLLIQSMTAFYEFEKAHLDYLNKKGEKPRIEKIKYGSDNFNILVINRTVVNYTEQIIPFLISLFLCATFVSVATAAKCGWLWLFFRSYYPLVFRKGIPWLFCSTLPAYSCIWTMLGLTISAISK
jgi:hypothetical protein